MEMYNCPLVGEKIRDDECYDINAAAFGIVRVDTIKHVFDRAVSAPACKACEHFQFEA